MFLPCLFDIEECVVFPITFVEQNYIGLVDGHSVFSS